MRVKQYDYMWLSVRGRPQQLAENGEDEREGRRHQAELSGVTPHKPPWTLLQSRYWRTPGALLLTEVQNHYLHLSYIYYCTWSVHLYVLVYYSDE
jgi:hypothetical protein